MNKNIGILFLFFLLIIPTVFIYILLAYAGNASDGLRLSGLSLPGYILYYFSIKYKNKLLSTLTVSWWAVFIIDALIRSFSWLMYSSDTDAYFIIQAIANTTYFEAVEFIQSKLWLIVLTILFFIFFISAYFYAIYNYISLSKITERISKPARNLIIVIFTILIIVSYAIRPSRVLFPTIYWTNYYQKIISFQQSITKHEKLHSNWRDKAHANIVYSPNFVERQTHVVAITDSVTSLNFGVCGYQRNTTPNIKKLLNKSKVFCNAFSPYASTINSLTTMLTDSSKEDPNDIPTESIFDFAKAAGFKIYWLSNQDDAYISSLFGKHATTTVFNNKRSGRSSVALDGELLPMYIEALADPHPRKLIILHFLGAHPNYFLRYPNQFNYFTDDSNDYVESELRARNIGFWIRKQRNEYDNAVLYQDWLFSQLLTLLENQKKSGNQSLIFLSDHGNEVGHEKNYAGHSANTKAGYQVPVVIWQNQMNKIGVNHNEIIDISELDANLMILMGLKNKADPELSMKGWLSEDYKFTPASNWVYWKN